MEVASVPHPPVVTQAEWLEKRLELLAKEKELTRHRDRINAERRRLPMVKIEKRYEFEGPNGKQSLVELFDGKRQLIVYHFMFEPDAEKGCGGCTGFVDAQGANADLGLRDTRFILVSRTPLSKLEAYKEAHGWSMPWYSSLGSDFNYDFHATQDEAVAPREYNYAPTDWKGEAHGLSVFFRLDDDVYHTYSTFGRGVETLTDDYALLDVTPYGRQEDFEDSPEGWPQRPTYG